MAEEGRVHILRDHCQVAIDCGSYKVYMHMNLYRIHAGGTEVFEDTDMKYLCL